MPKREARWVRVRVLNAGDKAAIAAVCDRFIVEVLKPRFLPEVRPTRVQLSSRHLRQMAGEQVQLHHALPLGVSGQSRGRVRFGVHAPRPRGRMPHGNPFRRDVASAHRAVVAPAFFRHARGSLAAHRRRNPCFNRTYEDQGHEPPFRSPRVARPGGRRRCSRAARPIIATGKCHSQPSNRGGCWRRSRARRTTGPRSRGAARTIGGDCSCPAFEDRGFCKHMVATALAANARAARERKAPVCSRASATT